MTAIVVLTVLVLIAVPNFIGRVDKAREAQVMTNMRLLATMLETYRTDWMEYPTNLSELGTGADLKGYNKEATNPMTNRRGKLGNPAEWAIDFVNPGPPGYVGYQVLAPTQYNLYGFDKDGKPIKRNGQPYRMTNG